MARQARIASESGIYHVILRGVNRMKVFYEETDYSVFLDRLRQQTEPHYEQQGTTTTTHCEIYAYCLMSNHIHLLIREVDEPIGMVMKRITSGYVYYFNHKYNRVGHLFQERFKSQPVEDEDYFVTLLRYIHQNPVKAEMVLTVGDYRWSSWHELMARQSDGLCNIQRVESLISKSELEDLVARPMNECEEEGILDYESSTEPIETGYLTIEDLQMLMLECSGCHTSEEFTHLAKPVQCEILGRMVMEGGNIRDISRVTGIPKSTAHRLASTWLEQHPAPSSIVADDSDVDDYPDY